MLLFVLEFSGAVPILALFAIFAFLVFRWGRRAWEQFQQHNAAREQMARTLGFAFFPQDTFGLTKQLKSFDLFRRERHWFGGGGNITNLMRSKVGDTDVYLFDYAYVVSSGKSRHTVWQTVFFADDKQWFLPNFRLKPETWWHKVLSKIGTHREIDFPENPDFSDKFWLTSEFEQLTRQTFSPAVQAFLAERQHVHMEGNNFYFLAYKPGKLLNTAEARTFFEHCCALAEVLKKEGGQEELLQLVELKKEEVEVAVPEAVRRS